MKALSIVAVLSMSIVILTVTAGVFSPPLHTPPIKYETIDTVITEAIINKLSREGIQTELTPPEMAIAISAVKEVMVFNAIDQFSRANLECFGGK